MQRRVSALPEPVRRLWKAHKLHRLALSLQRDKKLLGLLDWTAVILLAVHQQHRRLHLRYIRQRRSLHKSFHILQNRTLPLILSKRHPDIRRTVHTVQIDTRSANHRSLKPMVVTDDPATHKTAIAITVNPQPIRIHIGPLAQQVNPCHQIQKIFPTPVPQHRLQKIWPVRRRPPRIHSQHNISRARQDLMRNIVRIREPTIWSAMNIQHQRI